LEGLLEIVGLEIMSGLVHIQMAEGRGFQTAGAATLKLQVPSKVFTYEMESKVGFDNLRE